MKLRKKHCTNCPFINDGFLSIEKMAEIQTYLLSGTNHFCHNNSNKTICLGGRKFQLTAWHKIGLIKQPTAEALATSMREAGVTPEKHICG